MAKSYYKSIEGGDYLVSKAIFECTADAYINSSKPNENFGYYNIFWTGRKNCYTVYRTFLKFYLDMLPPDATILSAKLRLYVGCAPYPSVTQLLTPYVIIDPWEVGSVTWYNQPGYETGLFGSSVQINNIGFYESDVTPIISAWLNGMLDNNGILLRTEEDNDRENKRFIGSKASQCSQIYLRPLIVLKYKSLLPLCNVTLAGRDFTDFSQIVMTSDVFQCISAQNTSQFSMVTFFIKNNGINPAVVRLEISPNDVDFTQDDIDFTIGGGDLKALATMKFGKYTRVCFKSANPWQNTTLTIQMQAQV